MRIGQLFATPLMYAISTFVYGTPMTNKVPEPEMLVLLGIGAVALIVARWRGGK